jgi:hypothetical protein
MALTSNQVANIAIDLMGDNTPAVTGFAPTFDSSPAGVALATIYGPTVQAVEREFGWDFARRIFTPTLTANSPVSFLPGLTLEYLYPPFAVEIWQLLDPSNTDPNDPLPTVWTVGNNLVSGVQSKVIWTNVVGAQLVLNNNPTESVWDALFTESVTRMLASKLAMSLSGRPDTEQSFLQSSVAAAKANETRQG